MEWAQLALVVWFVFYFFTMILSFAIAVSAKAGCGKSVFVRSLVRSLVSVGITIALVALAGGFDKVF